MDKRQKLRDAKAAAHAAMTALLDGAANEARGLTAEEKTQYDQHKAAHASASDALAMLDETEAMGADLERPRPSRIGAAATGVRGPEAKRKFESLGEFVATVVNDPDDQRLVYRSMEMGEGKRGGFMVPQEFRTELQAVAPQDAIVRPRAFRLNSGTDAVKTWPVLNQGDTTGMYGGVRFAFTSEKKKIARSDVEAKRFSVQPKKAAGLVPISNELLRNWSGSGAAISNLLRQASAAFEDDKFLNGSGVGCPLGVLKSPALIKQARAASNKIGYVDAVSLLAKAKLGGNLVFVANQSALPQLMQMKDDGGNLVWAPSAREGEPMTLLGRPLMFNERSPQLGSLGDLALCDFGYYWIDDGTGPFIDVSEHAEFDSDQTLIRMVINVDGQPSVDGPITQEGGYKVSPFVALDA